MLAFKAIFSMGELNKKVRANFKALCFTKICPDFRKCPGANGYSALALPALSKPGVLKTYTSGIRVENYACGYVVATNVISR